MVEGLASKHRLAVGAAISRPRGDKQYTEKRFGKFVQSTNLPNLFFLLWPLLPGG